MLKKILFLLILSFLITRPVFAQNINELTSKAAGAGGYQTAGVTDLSLSQTVGRIISIALGLVGTIFLALTIYAGFIWMTASGNEEAVKKATGILRMAVIGLVIVLASYSITYFVTTYIFGATSSAGNQVGGNGEVYGNQGCCIISNSGKTCLENLDTNSCDIEKRKPQNAGNTVYHVSNCATGC